MLSLLVPASPFLFYPYPSSSPRNVHNWLLWVLKYNVSAQQMRGLSICKCIPSGLLPRQEELIGHKIALAHRAACALSLLSIHSGVALDAIGLCHAMAQHMANHFQHLAVQDPQAFLPDGSLDPFAGVLHLTVKVTADAARTMDVKLTWLLLSFILMHPCFLQGQHFCDIPPELFKKGTHHNLVYTMMLSGYNGGDNTAMMSANYAGEYRQDLCMQRTHEQWMALSVADLQEACSLNRMTTGGNKKEMADRLLRATMKATFKEDDEQAPKRSARKEAAASKKAAASNAASNKAAASKVASKTAVAAQPGGAKLGAPKASSAPPMVPPSQAVPTRTSARIQAAAQHRHQASRVSAAQAGSATAKTDSDSDSDGGLLDAFRGAPEHDSDDQGSSSSEDEGSAFPDNHPSQVLPIPDPAGAGPMEAVPASPPPPLSAAMEGADPPPGQQQPSSRHPQQSSRPPLTKASLEAGNTVLIQLLKVFSMVWSFTVQPLADSRPFRRVRVIMGRVLTFDCMAWWAATGRHPRSCSPSTATKPHKCGCFCTICDMQPCERSNMYTLRTLSETHALCKHVLGDGVPFTLRTISLAFRTPVHHQVNANFAAKLPAQEDHRHTCDCQQVQDQLRRAGAIHKVPFNGPGKIHYDRRPGSPGSQEGGTSRPEQYPEDAGDGHAPGVREKQHAGRREHGNCTDAWHQMEGQYFKPMTVDATSHITPNICRLPCFQDRVTAEEVLDQELPFEGEIADTHLVRVRYFHAPLHGHMGWYGDCALQGFDSVDDFMVCLLHGLMAHVRGALKLTMILILNQSLCPDRKRAKQVGTSQTRVEMFNNRFAPYGTGIFSEAVGSTKYAAPATKGPTATNILRDVAEQITRTVGEGGSLDTFEATQECLLFGIDDSQDTLALWYWMHQVFSIGRKHAPTRPDMAAYNVACFELKLAWRLRGNRELCVPYYIHIVCDHTPQLLELWGTLWLLCNNTSESYNKYLNNIWNHTTHQGANGRVSAAKKLAALQGGYDWHGKHGRAQEDCGMRAAAERLTLVYYYTLEEEIECMRAEQAQLDIEVGISAVHAMSVLAGVFRRAIQSGPQSAFRRHCAARILQASFRTVLQRRLRLPGSGDTPEAKRAATASNSAQAPRGQVPAGRMLSF